MKIPFFTATREYARLQSELDAAVLRVMAEGQYILGRDVQLFENTCARELGVAHAVGVASGSDALLLAADLMGFHKGVGVLTPTFSFFASTSCLVRLGAIPQFVDIDPQTLNMDVADASHRWDETTQGILPVHLFQQACDMNAVMDLANAHGWKVLEDAAEAFGMQTMYRGEWTQAGTIGHAGTFSFFPTKTLGGSGDGGMVVTKDPDMFQALCRYRVHGVRDKYCHQDLGYNSRLDTLQAAILNVKLAHLPAAISRRVALAQQYRQRLSKIEEITTIATQPFNREVPYVFNILVTQRDALAAWLTQSGIGTSIYYPIPLHLQPCFAHLGYRAGDFPVAERICTQILALPMYPDLTEGEVDQVCDAIEEFYRL